jgi:hypothetical protein
MTMTRLEQSHRASVPKGVEAGCPPEDGDRQQEWLKALANAKSLLDEKI